MEAPDSISLEFFFVRFATSAARCLLIVGAVISASCHKDVTATSSVTSVSVTPTNISLLVGDTITLKASESDINGLDVVGASASWSSSDTTIAIVNSAGHVTARKVGSVNIIATSGTATGTGKITVVAALPPSISSIIVAPSPAFVVVHGTQQLTATVRDASGSVITGLTVVWQSNNPGVATVSSTGLVTGVTNGSAIISASIGGFLGTSSVTVQTVITLGPSSVAVSPTAATVGIGRTQQFTATATDSTGNTFPNATATWSSSNPAIVSISATGLATGVSAGVATITGTAFGGNGTATVTVQVLHLIAVSAGDLHSCGLQTDGSAWCWGGDQADQLGDSTQTNSTSPVATHGGLKFAALSAGYAHNCALTATNVAFCWGDNTSGELGDGTTLHRSLPVAVSGGATFTSLTAGQDHTCGLTAAGAAWCWGNNLSGQLGNGLTVNSSAPVAVGGGITFASLSAGFQNTCGIATNGAAWCWGDNTRGQLGNGTFNSSATPVKVTSSATFIAVGAGFQHVCAVATGGAAFCWGSNDNGQLGTGDTQAHTTPVAVLGGNLFATIGAGGLYTCGLAASGGAFCWGDNIWGELGTGVTSPLSNVPVAVAGGLSFRTLSTGNYHVCAMAGGNTAYCWGDGGQGQLGNGSNNLSASPVKVIYQP
ncbi:MAG TPA: Ig-like domain-containing protein [Gemmatimonadaceae bacterium]|nr:Ig-like domain-containing protein [Gemmatimonadaceae bacterium]